VVYTSRQELQFADPEERLSAGQRISQFLVDIVKRAPSGLAWLMGKGGITSHHLLVEGLGVRTARVLGQVLPGVPAIRTAPDSLRPDIPYVIFPGNVGDDSAVLDAFRVLTGEKR
jgi:uncharacterized protein YgbK (DUF1537 family)